MPWSSSQAPRSPRSEGILALWLRGMPFTISTGVGLVAVCGVFLLVGLVMVSTIR